MPDANSLFLALSYLRLHKSLELSNYLARTIRNARRARSLESPFTIVFYFCVAQSNSIAYNS